MYIFVRILYGVGRAEWTRGRATGGGITSGGNAPRLICPSVIINQ